MPAALAASLPIGEVVKIVLPGPVVAKGRPRGTIIHSKTKGDFISWYTPAETVAYENAVAWAGKVAMRGRKPLRGALRVTVTAFFKPPPSWSEKNKAKALNGEIRPSVKPDFDNVAKCAIDGLNKIVYWDDAQIVDATIIKEYGTPRLEIEVQEL